MVQIMILFGKPMPNTPYIALALCIEFENCIYTYIYIAKYSVYLYNLPWLDQR